MNAESARLSAENLRGIEIATARNGETDLNTRLGKMDTARNAVIDEVSTARGSEASLDARLDGIDLKTTATDTELDGAKLKIINVEKDVNILQKTIESVNINQEVKQTVSGYGVVSLPKNAANGNLETVLTGVTADGKNTAGTYRLKSVNLGATQQTSKYISGNTILRCLPNGVGDSDGFRNISDEYTLKESDITAMDTTLNNIDYVLIPISVFMNLKDSGLSDAVGNKMTTSKTTPRNNEVLDSVANAWKHYFVTTSLRVTFPKGTYTNLATAKTALAGTKILYQLATPIPVPVDVSGTLLSYPSGTIYRESAIADAGLYTDTMTILKTAYPIKALEYIEKVDFATGNITVLPTATAVIAGNGLSFTHPQLVDGDIVGFTYFYDDSIYTEGKLDCTFYDSRYCLKDTANGKYYKIVQTITNGVLSAETLVEV